MGFASSFHRSALSLSLSGLVGGDSVVPVCCRAAFSSSLCCFSAWDFSSGGGSFLVVVFAFV